MFEKTPRCITAVLTVVLGLRPPPPARAQQPAQPGSPSPAAPLSRLFTRDTYTEYTLLDPGTQLFRVRFLTDESRVGSAEFEWIRFEGQLLANSTGGDREGSDIEVYDPRTGKPLTFTYGTPGLGSANPFIRVTLLSPVPEGGIGRVLIYKTFKDPHSYMVHGDDITWVRNPIGYRLGLVLPKGYGFVSSDVAAQLTTQADGRLKLAFVSPGAQSGPVTIHARKTSASFQPVQYDDIFFADTKTLYNLDAPESHGIRFEQTYSDFRKGNTAKLDSLANLPLQDLKVIDMDTAKAFTPVKAGTATVVKLDVPIVDDKQSAHIKISGTLKDPGYRVENGDLVFERAVHGLRNTVLLPENWDVAAVSQSGTIGTYRGRAFVAFMNLNAENNYKVTIHARKRASTP